MHKSLRFKVFIQAPDRSFAGSEGENKGLHFSPNLSMFNANKKYWYYIATNLSAVKCEQHYIISYVFFLLTKVSYPLLATVI